MGRVRVRMRHGEVGIRGQSPAISCGRCSRSSGRSRHGCGLQGPRRRYSSESLERKPVAHVEARGRKPSGRSRRRWSQKRCVHVRRLLLRQCCPVSGPLQMRSCCRRAGREIHELRQLSLLLLHGQVVHEVVLAKGGVERIGLAPVAQPLLGHVRHQLRHERRRALLLLLQHERALAPDARLLLAHLPHALIEPRSRHHHPVLQPLDGHARFVNVAAVQRVLLAQRRHLREQQQQARTTGNKSSVISTRNRQKLSRANVSLLLSSSCCAQTCSMSAALSSSRTSRSVRTFSTS